MDSFKTELWEGDLPNIDNISKNKIKELHTKLSLKFLHRIEPDMHIFFNNLQKIETQIGIAGNTDWIIRLKNICPYIEKNSYIYIDWNGFNDLDRVNLEDFLSNINNFWYADSDDISIFDDSCEWVVNIYHYGDVNFSLCPDLLRCYNYNEHYVQN